MVCISYFFIFAALRINAEEMKKLFLLSLYVCLLAGLVACGEDDEVRKRPEIASRTVLVYIAGDNSLRSYASLNKDQMIEGIKEVDDIDNNFLIYLDDGNTPQLIKLEKDKKGRVIEKVIVTYESRNSVNVANMQEVLSTAFGEYPANSYGLVLWSHGEGWIPRKSKTRWWGQDGNNYMDITELHEALSVAPHLDYILFDACFMQAVEVVYELRDCAEYIIGSPTEIPGPGAPYQKVVPAMFKNGISAINVAGAYYDFYASLYTGHFPADWKTEDPWVAGVSVGVVKTEYLEELASLTRQLLPEYIQNQEPISVSGILYYDRRFSRYYYDFVDFMESLDGESSAYQAWKTVYDKTVVYWKTTPTNYSDWGKDFSMEGSNGLSTFIPRFNNNLDYSKCEWYSAAGWNETGW